MIKAEIAEYVISNTSLTKSQAIAAVDCIFAAIAQSLSKGENVYVRGFATFKVHKISERKARNISKGTTVIIPAHSSVKLIPSKEIKNKMNK